MYSFFRLLPWAQLEWGSQAWSEAIQLHNSGVLKRSPAQEGAKTLQKEMVSKRHYKLVKGAILTRWSRSWRCERGDQLEQHRSARRLARRRLQHLHGEHRPRLRSVPHPLQRGAGRPQPHRRVEALRPRGSAAAQVERSHMSLSSAATSGCSACVLLESGFATRSAQSGVSWRLFCLQNNALRLICFMCIVHERFVLVGTSKIYRSHTWS